MPNSHYQGIMYDPKNCLQDNFGLFKIRPKFLSYCIAQPNVLAIFGTQVRVSVESLMAEDVITLRRTEAYGTIDMPSMSFCK